MLHGRYSQADPLGTAGGWNRYLYVLGNPFGYADPRGLDNPSMGPYGPRPNGTSFADLIGEVDCHGCISTTPGGPKICVGPAAIEALGAKAIQMLFRRGAYDTKKLLQTQAEAAEKSSIAIHGVSVSTSPAAKGGQVVRCANCTAIEEAGFKVHKTGSNADHYTVELPKPITSEITRIWNELFK